VGDRFAFGEAYGQAGVESVASAYGVDGIDAEGGDFFQAFARGPEDALGAAGEHDVFGAESEEGGG